MSGRAAVVHGLAAALALAAWAGAEELVWHGRLAPGQTLEVKGINGSISASAAGAEGEVRATKYSRHGDTAGVEVKAVEHAGGVTVCAVYPSRSGSAPNECAPGRGGRMDARDNDVEVDFTVTVPVGVRFVGRTVNGRVDATGLPGDADIHTVNGGVKVSAAGNVEAQTVNGSITASAGRADWDGRADFQTVNGSITLELPGEASAEVSAQTVNGSIETDFPLTVHGRFLQRSLAGTIGGGGRQLRLQTVNGGIKIRKSG